MKVLHVSGARIWGGNEQQLEYLVKELNKRNVEQFLFCYASTPLAEKFEDLPVSLYPVPFVKPYKKDYRQALKQAVEQIGPDIIHLHTSDSVTGFVVSDLFCDLGVKTVFSKKGISRKMTFLSKYKYNYKDIDRIICVSEMVNREFGKIIKPKNLHKLSVIPDGFAIEASSNIPVPNLREELKLDQKTVVIGNISNHAWRKDLPTFIKTAGYLIHELKQKNLHFVQIGKENKLTPRLKEMLKELNLEEHFTFLGFQPYASRVYPQFDVFLITSKEEGGPSSVFEAFYLKTPVVATRVGIIPEAIEHGKSGFISEPGDYKALAENVMKLIKNKKLAEEVVENAYQTLLNNYTASQLGERHYRLYCDLLQE